MKCERCECFHDGSFASGRFCSRACANSRLRSRAEINQKISDSLKKTNAIKLAKRLLPKLCSYCGNPFSHQRNKTCSKSCALAKTHSSEVRERLSHNAALRIASDTSYSKRLKSIRCEFEFRGKKIRCDSKVEYACLDYVVNNYDVATIERCQFVIPFEFEGSKRHYVPDFLVTTTNDITLIVEAKCEFIHNHLRAKWRYYYESIPAKKEALVKYCSERGYSVLYFDRSMHRKFYNALKFGS